MNQKQILAVGVALSMSVLSQHTLAADSTTLVSSSVTLSNMSYSVVDLNKWDLYWWPSVKAVGTTQIRGSMEVVKDDLSSAPPITVSKPLQGTPLLSTTGSVTLPNGQATVVANGTTEFKASTGVSAAEINTVLNQMTANVATQPWQRYEVKAIGHLVSEPMYAPGSTGFTLSAKSALVIQGTYSVESDINASLFDAAALANFKAIHPDGFTLSTVADFSGTFRLTGNNGMPPSGVTVSYNEGFSGSATSGATYYNVRSGSFLFNGNDSARSFTMTLTNNTTKAVSGSLDLQVLSGLVLMSTQVPEPGTWALMGLGLLGVAVASRRARQG